MVDRAGGQDGAARLARCGRAVHERASWRATLLHAYFIEVLDGNRLRVHGRLPADRAEPRIAHDVDPEPFDRHDIGAFFEFPQPTPAGRLSELLRPALLQPWLGCRTPGGSIEVERIDDAGAAAVGSAADRREEHTSELQSPYVTAQAVFCFK